MVQRHDGYRRSPVRRKHRNNHRNTKTRRHQDTKVSQTLPSHLSGESRSPSPPWIPAFAGKGKNVSILVYQTCLMTLGAREDRRQPQVERGRRRVTWPILRPGGALVLP